MSRKRRKEEPDLPSPKDCSELLESRGLTRADLVQRFQQLNPSRKGTENKVTFPRSKENIKRCLIDLVELALVYISQVRTVNGIGMSLDSAFALLCRLLMLFLDCILRLFLSS